ncbi:MAG: Acyl-CoA dehydrogenase, partial [uncultured Acidimicrobiales bacterium]
GGDPCAPVRAHRSGGGRRDRGHGAALRRAGGPAGRDRARARRRVPGSHRRGDGRPRAVRRHDPRRPRGPRTRRRHLHTDRRGAFRRVDVALRRRQHPPDRSRAARPPRHRRPAGQVAAGHGHRSAPGVPVPLGAGRRERHPGVAVPGHPRRPGVRDRRDEDVGDQRRPGRHRRPRRAHTRRHHVLHGREGARRAPRRDLGHPQHRQARLQGPRDGRDDLRRPPRAGLVGARRSRRPRQGPPPDPRRPRARSDQHRGSRLRGRAGCVRGVAPLRHRAEDVRQAHRRAPGHPVQAGGHGHQARGQPPAHPQRGRAVPVGGTGGRRGGHGQALRQRVRPRDRDRGDAGARRLRVRHRAADRALLPGRAPDGHRRGHERDPAHRDRTWPPPTAERVEL